MTKAEQREIDQQKYLDNAHVCDSTCKSHFFNVDFLEECCLLPNRYIHKQKGKVCDDYKGVENE